MMEAESSNDEAMNDENIVNTVSISGIPVSIALDQNRMQQQDNLDMFSSSEQQNINMLVPSEASNIFMSSSNILPDSNSYTSCKNTNTDSPPEKRYFSSILENREKIGPSTSKNLSNESFSNFNEQTEPDMSMQVDNPVVLEDYSDDYLKNVDECHNTYMTWSANEQVDFVQKLLDQMSHYQLGKVSSYLEPILKRDFVSIFSSMGLQHISESILSYLDAKSLCSSELVCRDWYRVVSSGKMWRKLIERIVKNDSLWKGLASRREWGYFLTKKGLTEKDDVFYKELYPKILKEINVIEENWRQGLFKLSHIQCMSEGSKGVYCLQYDNDKIVSGLRDNTIKMWDRKTLQCTKVLQGHTGSVLCLQYDENVIITGSSDSTVRVWCVRTGEEINLLQHHCEAVLHLRFNNGLMVTCSKDRSIAVWDMISANKINMRRVLVGHRAAVNVVDFDEKYIVSASGDRTIKVWLSSTCEFVRTLNGHRRGIACLQYRDNLIVSGSSDNTIRLWNIESGACVRILEGHNELVRCIRFDSRRIVSGAYDGKIKVWDLKKALDPSCNLEDVCIQTLEKHTGRVFRLQFDEFQIVSSSHDDSILIWDFQNTNDNKPEDLSLQVENELMQDDENVNNPLE